MCIHMSMHLTAIDACLDVVASRALYDSTLGDAAAAANAARASEAEASVRRPRRRRRRHEEALTEYETAMTHEPPPRWGNCLMMP